MNMESNNDLLDLRDTLREFAAARDKIVKNAVKHPAPPAKEGQDL